MDRLLKHLDHGNAAHVLGAGLVHAHERAHIGLHELAALAAHHGRHGANRYDDRDEAGRAQAPIKGKEQHEQACNHSCSARDVGQHVREQRLGRSSAPVHDAAQLTGGARIEVAERQLEQMPTCGLANIGGAAERRQVRAHEAREVNDDARQGKAYSPPAVRRDACSLAPVRGHGDEVARYEPNAHVGSKAQKLRHRREPHPQVREAFAITRVRKQLAHAPCFLFLLSHADSFLLA